MCCMPEKMLWSTWSARAWPLSVDEERSLRHQLGNPSPEFDRDDISFLTTALRCGAGLEVISTVAPGLDRARLAGAYDHLDRLRSEAVDEFRVFMDTAGAVDDLSTLHLSAARLMPVAVGRVVAVHGAFDFDRVYGRVRSLLHDYRVAVLGVEERLEAEAHLPELCRRLAVELHNPFGLGLWGHPFYLPRRVTDLSSGRVRDLLGEGE